MHSIIQKESSTGAYEGEVQRVRQLPPPERYVRKEKSKNKVKNAVLESAKIELPSGATHLKDGAQSVDYYDVLFDAMATSHAVESNTMSLCFFGSMNESM